MLSLLYFLLTLTYSIIDFFFGGDVDGSADLALCLVIEGGLEFFIFIVIERQSALLEVFLHVADLKKLSEVVDPFLYLKTG